MCISQLIELQFHWEETEPPPSLCSLPCQPDQAKKYMEGESCCWECRECIHYQVNSSVTHQQPHLLNQSTANAQDMQLLIKRGDVTLSYPVLGFPTNAAMKWTGSVCDCSLLPFIHSFLFVCLFVLSVNFRFAIRKMKHNV